MPTPDKSRRTARDHLASPPQILLPLPTRTLTLTSAWGLFSAKSIDEGTALLLNEVQALDSPKNALDLGCGYGPIGLTLAGLWPQAQVTCVDKDLLAVETTRANIAHNQLTNATVVLSPGLRDVPADHYDLICSNLPAQAGNEALDELLLDAYDHLSPGGSLVVVVVSGLGQYIKRRLTDLFGNYNKAKQGSRHLVAEAIREP